VGRSPVAGPRVHSASNASTWTQPLAQISRPRTAPEWLMTDYECPFQIHVPARLSGTLGWTATPVSTSLVSSSHHAWAPKTEPLACLSPLPAPLAPSSPLSNSSVRNATTSLPMQHCLPYAFIPMSTPHLPIAQLETGLPPHRDSSSSLPHTCTPTGQPPSSLFAPSSALQLHACSYRPRTLQPNPPALHIEPKRPGNESDDTWTPPALKKRYADKRRERARARERGPEPTSPANQLGSKSELYDASRTYNSPSHTPTAQLSTGCFPGGSPTSAASSAPFAHESIGRARHRKAPRHPGHQYTGVSCKKSCDRQTLCNMLRFKSQFYRNCRSFAQDQAEEDLVLYTSNTPICIKLYPTPTLDQEWQQ
jgi:hypothetical protein